MRLVLLLLIINSNPLFAKTAEAIFAGGCFWCMEADFEKLDGVLETISGYDGGTTPNPTYASVASGKTNYTESVRIIYDPRKLTYQQLVDYFWHHIDPTVKEAQFCDQGHHYRTAIFYLNEEQKNIALASKQRLQKKFPIIYTEIIPSTQFYAAEEYHQNYYKNNPLRYKFYRYRCGRDQRINEVWKE
ncbi:MsrA3 - peptide methionine sulfoxide reductase [Legionella beliardensis]|uniref:Peptide methionine sulfoxide reductase MsrA n=1 Tax=Legionella beliardensis TaxID=91822 RepID=A0A378I591_9GAMM|nr:peptide-methionine (S)-S-oxide reductase MsrA [Legionella beliardensis]STX30012.1 MsrA3 - peptide methionine sulfoxide reductase [Legionella beliardensis]